VSRGPWKEEPAPAGSWVPLPYRTAGRRSADSLVPHFGTGPAYAGLVAKKQRPATWSEVGYRNAGMRATFRGLTFAIRWAAVTATLKREPASIDEFCEVLDEARRTAFRDQQAFRAAFPSEATPLRMITDTGVLARFEELVRTLDNLDQVTGQLAPLAFTLGAAPASFA